MSLASQLDRYLAVRRSLGYDLRTSERVLRRFIRFADDTGAKHVDPDLFLRWDASQPIAGSSTRSARLGMVRLFALWLSSVDPWADMFDLLRPDRCHGTQDQRSAGAGYRRP